MNEFLPVLGFSPSVSFLWSLFFLRPCVAQQSTTCNDNLLHLTKDSGSGGNWLIAELTTGARSELTTGARSELTTGAVSELTTGAVSELTTGATSDFSSSS